MAPALRARVKNVAWNTSSAFCRCRRRSLTHAPHQRSMPMQQRRERRFIVSSQEPVQQLCIGVFTKLLDRRQLANVLHYGMDGPGVHAFDSRQAPG